MTDLQSPQLDILDTLATGIAQLEYSLLLGAGASLGAIGGNGRPLPTATGLRDALVSDFEVDTGGETISLAEAYDYLNNTRASQLSRYLKTWFTHCQPTWQSTIAGFNWRRIWTFNIDDVMEKVYSQEGRLTKSVSWNQRFTERDTPNAQQIIHLHGLASNLKVSGDNEDVLVFSASEYARAIASPRTWHKVFSDEFAGRPFIVIGARLVEEVDLAEVLDNGSAAARSTGFPSVLVVPNIPPIRKERLQNAGLTVIEQDGEHFMQLLWERYQLIRSQFDAIYHTSTPGTRRFQTQFIDLRRFTPHGLNDSDFYSGYQPTWNTILNDDDAILDKTHQALGKSSGAIASSDAQQSIIFLTGHAGSGKSTGLLRIASGLMAKGANPFLFRGEEYMDVDAAVEWLKSVPRTVLLIDDCCDFSSTIQQLVERCDAEKVRMVLVCADRSAKLKVIRDRIDERYFVSDRVCWYGKLSGDDVDRILDKLHSRGRLGQITRWNRPEQQRHFLEIAGARLFDGMSELEGGLGFKEKAEGVYSGLPTEQLKSLYVAACLCYEQGIPLPTGIGAGFVGVPPRSLMMLIERECEGILLLTKSGIRPPHRIMAALVVNTLQRSVKSPASLSLAKALAPHVDEQAMRKGTAEYRIIRHLMDQATVRRLVGDRHARNWYDELREYYDWNGRYWDQRALLESRLGDHETARSYAERSIEVHPHSFGYNTLGTVLMHMAIRYGNSDPLLEGLSHLNKAKSFLDWGEREHPFVTFFNLLNRYVEDWGTSALPDRARRAWAEWLHDAYSSTMFSHPAQRARLEQWNKQWMLHWAIE